jgi:YjbE family integral membrane protein
LDLFTAEFWAALLTIVVIDLVLAGDNAIVIALAARNLPTHLQKKAIIWGTFGAIAIRALFTMVAVWLLKIPGLLLAGGALLVWIAYKLMVGDKKHDNIASATTFAQAMRTIIIADAVMGIDNILAIAGAAHGSFILVVLGLLISIPIVVWGSTLILKLTDKYSWITHLGAGVLALTAGKMIAADPTLKNFFFNPTIRWGFIIAVVALVMFFGITRSRKNAPKKAMS